MSDTLQNDEALGLSIDMLDADRLGQWAANIQTYGSNISEWGSRLFVVNELQRLSGAIASAVRDIGTLRAEVEKLKAERAKLRDARERSDELEPDEDVPPKG